MNLLGTVLTRVLAPGLEVLFGPLVLGATSDVWSYAVSVVGLGSAVVESDLSLPLGLSF